MVLTALLALSLVWNVQETASHWIHQKMDSRPAKTVPRECSPSSPAQMTQINVARNAPLVITATLAWPPVLHVLQTTSSLLLDKGNASNVNLEKKLQRLELPVRMTANLLSVITTCANMVDCAYPFITDPSATALLGLLGSTVR